MLSLLAFAPRGWDSFCTAPRPDRMCAACFSCGLHCSNTCTGPNRTCAGVFAWAAFSARTTGSLLIGEPYSCIRVQGSWHSTNIQVYAKLTPVRYRPAQLASTCSKFDMLQGVRVKRHVPQNEMCEVRRRSHRSLACCIRLFCYRHTMDLCWTPAGVSLWLSRPLLTRRCLKLFLNFCWCISCRAVQSHGNAQHQPPPQRLSDRENVRALCIRSSNCCTSHSMTVTQNWGNCSSAQRDHQTIHMVYRCGRKRLSGEHGVMFKGW